MDVIKKYYEAEQEIINHLSLPQNWTSITWDFCEECFWYLNEDKSMVVFYESIDEYNNDCENEEGYQVEIITSDLWRNKETIPKEYTGIFIGKSYTGFLVNDSESIDEMIVAVFDNKKNIDILEDE